MRARSSPNPQKRSQSKSLQYERYDRGNWISEQGQCEALGNSRALGSFGVSKSLLRFTAPAEVKGVLLLIVNHPDRASDQWMWTPGLGRDRHIALQNRATGFFGTGFSFEDLEERDLNQFDYKMLGAETVDRQPVLEDRIQTQGVKSSQYTSSFY